MNTRAISSIEHNAPKLLLQVLVHKLYKKGEFIFIVIIHNFSSQLLAKELALNTGKLPPGSLHRKSVVTRL